mgnify:CR=1 FL=1
MIEVRDASLEDAGRILEIYAYYVKNTAITFEYEVPSVDEFRSRMERTMRKYPISSFCATGSSRATPTRAPSSAGRHTIGPAR